MNIRQFFTGSDGKSKAVSTDNQLPVIPYYVDEFGVISRALCDNLYAGAPVVIDVDHHEIHCGDSFMVTRSTDLTNGAVDTIIINVPNETGNPKKLYHLTLTVTSEAECNLDLYEGSTTVSDGTTIDVFNRDRNSLLVSGLTFFHTPNTPAAGTLIETRHWGGGKSTGGESRGSQEIILKNNTKYRLVLTNSTTSNNYVSWEINHYIHPGI